MELGDLQTLPGQAGEAKQVPAPTEQMPLPNKEKQVLGVTSCEGQFRKAPSSGKGKSLQSLVSSGNKPNLTEQTVIYVFSETPGPGSPFCSHVTLPNMI